MLLFSRIESSPDLETRRDLRTMMIQNQRYGLSGLSIKTKIRHNDSEQLSGYLRLKAALNL
jgi:hypothetical protein